MIKKIFISINKDSGIKCKEWALNNLPDGFEIVNDMNECNIFISVQYDKILSKEFVQSRNCYNFHPNLLPNYGGVGTITQSLLNGEEYGGVTLHEIDKGIDTGDIIELIKIKIDEDETAYSLHLKTMDVLFKMFKDRFFDLLYKSFTTSKQDLTNYKVYTYKEFDEIFNLTRYMRATFYPGKDEPYFYTKSGEKIKLSYDILRGIEL